MAKNGEPMNNPTKKKTNPRTSKPGWPADKKVPSAATPAEERTWDEYSFASAMDEGSERLVYEPKATSRPRTLVYRLRLDESEMASLQRLAKQRGVSVSVIIRGLVGEAGRDSQSFEVRPAPSAMIKDPQQPQAARGSFAHVLIVNRGHFVPRARCWISFLRKDGSSVFPTEMPARWSAAPEPIAANAVATRPGQFELVHFVDPSKLAAGYVQDIAPEEEQPIAVAIKFSDGSAWGWTQESYMHNWQHPEWKLPNEILRVRTRVVAEGRSFTSEFELDCGTTVDRFSVSSRNERKPREQTRAKLREVPYVQLVRTTK